MAWTIAVVIEETSNLELSCFGDCDGIINFQHQEERDYYILGLH